uniref:Inosose dehydratase n=1 Tax=uncultured Nocardioidaceae bacterium TaxID=253824 RepID=A0A6J4MMY0_9ACTN|nr:MAG: Inosose dehydratase [uncultured Nocardioidaceae bacterium]
MTALRVAGAPISWGVCEVPGWGHQLGADRVLTEMRALGLEATEFGPAGFLPDEPLEKAAVLSDHGLRAVGGFLPVVLHDPRSDPLPAVEVFAEGCVATGAGVVVLAAATGIDGYDERPALDERGWSTLLANLDRASAVTAARGVVTALHPHVGTMVERGDEVARVLSGSLVGLCVDTGHLLAGGTDPVALVREHPDRVVHVHLKDLDAALADEVRSGRLSYAGAIPRGLFAPLGRGDIDIAALVGTLLAAGYDGWFVLEQDVMLAGDPVGEGPAADVRVSLEHLREVAR